MDDRERRKLLSVARQSLTAMLSAGGAKRGSFGLEWNDPTPRGVFVTLRRGKRLRGCIGTLNAAQCLPQCVWMMAAAAASDPRFADIPVTLEELPELSIEISVLSPPRRVDDPTTLRVGIDGIHVRSAGGSGCFLPEVAREHGWSAEEFLSKCCSEKAGIAADAWKDPRTTVSLFTVEKIADDVVPDV